ncbi:MAG: DUF4406 domain-containing protein [Alphaproteobacteria bacterium]
MTQELIMIAGPYSSGTKTEEERSANLEVLNKAALEVFRKGHIPLIGVNNALPLIAIAGEDSFDEIMMPLSIALAERCDSCLRVDGASNGADQEVENFRNRGKSVYFSVEEIPNTK